MTPPVRPSDLTRARARRRGLTWMAWLAVLAALTAGLLAERSRLDQSHVVLALLLVVLGGSATGGRRLGVVLALAASLVIDYFFQVPYGFVSIGHILDGVVLAAFLAVALVTTELLERAKTEARTARARAAELVAMAAERDRMASAVRAANELREANRTKDAVLAAVSHDLRTPITTIRALVGEGVAAGDITALAVEEQAGHLARLVTQVLDFASIRAGSSPSAPESNVVEDLLGAVIRRSEGIRGARRVVPRIALTTPPLTGRFDFDQTVRILGNLVDNALRYSPPGEVVELAAEARDDLIVVTVSDRGGGIAVDEVPQVFEAFHRSPSEAHAAGHAGLGLAISRELALAQGGTLRYEPRAGGGSVFVLELPREHADPCDETMTD